jgi:GWxTD domain-containing protein
VKRLSIAVVTALVSATTAFAAVSPEKANWAKGPVQFLMTPEDVAQWSSLQDDAAADQFIALFWARRDPTPGTPANEFREDFEARVAGADKQLGTKTVRGALTDQGKTLILFGAPSRAQRSGGSRTGTFRDRERPESEDASQSTSVWMYEGEAAQKYFNASRVELQFIDRLNNGEMRLNPGRVDYPGAQRRAIAAAITQPNLTKLPTAQSQPAAGQSAAPVPAVVPTTFKTAALETAIADAKAGKVTAKGASIEAAEFLSPQGEDYIPLALFVPASAAVTADSVDTFFGVIEDSTGKRVEAFEVPAKATASKNSLLFDYTANLAPGTYTATIGLAKAGVPVLIASGPVQASGVAKDFVGTSRLVLSDIMETIEAAPVKSPFAFGRLKIVPRSSFSNKEELGYFIELHNPGIDPASSLPKVQTKIDLIPPSGPAISAPLTDAQALPLSGAVGPGEYAVISGIPLGDMKTPLKAGEYTLRVKVLDTVTKKSFTVEQKFKITG